MADIRGQLDELFRVTHPRLVVSMFALTGDAREAEDVVQEAFVRAVLHARRVLDADSPEAWLRRVARNVAHSRWRRRIRLKQLVGLSEPRPPSVPDMPEDRLAVHAAIRTLPRHFREVIALHYVADVPVDEIADMLGVSLGTVKSRLFRGRQALRAALSDFDPFEPQGPVEQFRGAIAEPKRRLTARRNRPRGAATPGGPAAPPDDVWISTLNPPELHDRT